MQTIDTFRNISRHDITCRAEKNELAKVLELAIDLSGHTDMFTRSSNRVKPAYQITRDKKCIAIASGSMAASDVHKGFETPEYWHDMDDEYSPERLASTLLNLIKHVTTVRVRSYYSFTLDNPNHNIMNPSECFLVIEPEF